MNVFQGSFLKFLLRYGLIKFQIKQIVFVITQRKFLERMLNSKCKFDFQVDSFKSGCGTNEIIASLSAPASTALSKSGRICHARVSSIKNKL